MSKERLATGSIYAFTDLRAYLTEVLRHCTEVRGLSVRAVARACGIKSPGYLTEVAAGRRNMTRVSAVKIAAGLGLDKIETEYFETLLELASIKDPLAMDSRLEKMRRIIGKAQQVDIKDPSIHDSWLHAAVFELSKTADYTPEVEAIRNRFRVNARADDIAASLRFLEGKKLPANANFVPINDIRRIDIKKKHLLYLQMAQHRLNDPIDEREFQGLTVAIRCEHFAVLKERVRAFIASVNEEFAADADADEVVRVQLAAFKLTR